MTSRRLYHILKKKVSIPMLWDTVLTIILITSVILIAVNIASNNTTEKNRLVEIPENDNHTNHPIKSDKIINLGSIPLGQKTEGNLKVYNDSSVTAEISDITASCGCTLIGDFPRSIPKKSVITIPFTISPSPQETYFSSKFIYIRGRLSIQNDSGMFEMCTEIRATVDLSLGLQVSPKTISLKHPDSEGDSSEAVLEISGSQDLLSRIPSVLNIQKEPEYIIDLQDISRRNLPIAKKKCILRITQSAEFSPTKKIVFQWNLENISHRREVLIHIYKSRSLNITPSVIKLSHPLDPYVDLKIRLPNAKHAAVHVVNPLKREEWTVSYSRDDCGELSATVKIERIAIERLRNTTARSITVIANEGNDRLSSVIPLLFSRYSPDIPKKVEMK